MNVIKRDGRVVEFDKTKIYNAIFKASQAVGGELEPADIEYITYKVVSQMPDRCSVEQIQDTVERTLIRYDFEKTAKAYILYRAQRAKIREAKSELMEIYDEITGTDAKNSNIKRENANVDGDTAMGSMLKYGSEGAKYYVDKYVLPEKIAKAHIDGDIHIHDKDFYLLTETCVTEDMILELKFGNTKKVIRAKELEELFPEIRRPDTVCYVGGLHIMSGGRYTEVINVVSHSSEDKTVLRIKTDLGSLEVTSDHRVSTFDSENLIEDVKAYSLAPGMRLVRNLDGNLAAAEVESVEVIEYSGKVYDLETVDHHFDANGFRVHNCVQIDLSKLFRNGFSTGHGYLREPQSIGSYASLACIAIQANQNDQHGGQSIPAFDVFMAPGVLKTFKKEFKQELAYEIEDLYGISPAESEALASEFTEKIEGISFDPVEAGFAEELAVKLNSHNVSLEFVKDMFSKTYERAFKKTEKATYQAMESLVHNLNTMNSRAGAQVNIGA